MLLLCSDAPGLEVLEFGGFKRGCGFGGACVFTGEVKGGTPPPTVPVSECPTGLAKLG